MTEAELQDIADTYGLYTEEDVKNRLSCELLRIGARNEELEAQIEKMKCCENCRRNTPFFFCEECIRFKGPLSPAAIDKWELKED